MAEAGRSFRPPPVISGVTETPDRDDLMRQLASGAQERDQMMNPALAAPLLEQGMMQLQQAAMLDPRLRPLVQKALSVLTGNDGAETMPHSSTRQQGPRPGGKLQY